MLNIKRILKCIKLAFHYVTINVHFVSTVCHATELFQSYLNKWYLVK